jgi:hypothetical protein
MRRPGGPSGRANGIEERAQWMNDKLSECFDNDALWGFAIRNVEWASDQKVGVLWGYGLT